MTVVDKKYEIPVNCQDVGTGKKAHIITFGCQMNEHDSEIIESFLKSMGYEMTGEGSEADLIVVNTCCVRETAENKVFGLLGRLRKLKNNNPDLIIAVGGCMTQQETMGKKIKERFHHVDIVYGTHNLQRLPELIKDAAEERRRVFEIWSAPPESIENLPERTVAGARAWVCIMYGCNNYCSYCIVPYVRGHERSRSPREIVEEVTSLVAQGIKEVTLLGQNVNSYGKDLKRKMDFADLLMEMESIDGLDRVRFMTSHPRDFTDKLISTLAEAKKVCEHVHLPVQAGSNEILKAMNRGYTREQYMQLIDKISTYIPGVSLTTDIIVGFPGETEEDFMDTVDLLKRIKFDGAYIFIYNPRSGTPAAEFTNQVPDELKRERIQKLLEVQNEFTLQSNREEIGKIHKVLVEGRSKTKKDKLSGRTRTNKTVVFYGEKELTGKVVSVKITGSGLTHLEGEVILE